LEFFEEVQLGDIWSTQSVNQPASVPIHGLEGQCDDFLDEGCGDDVVDSESDHYDELLVRCEGDTDVEELYPTRAEAVVHDVMSKAEMMKEARVKKAKHKAQKSRAAKRRALEGDVEEEGMTFGDQVSDDCKELTDSSDDDQVVDGNDISLITKKRSRSKKAFKRAYYDESRLNAPPHQQHVRGAWTGRGRARHSDHYMNSRSYSYFTAGLEAQQRENTIQDGME
jgi:hypothetical protein